MNALNYLLLAPAISLDGVLDTLGRLARTSAWTLCFVVLGLVFFALAFWLMAKVCPFSIRKEIEDDQNISLAVIMGSVILGIAIIIAAAIHG